MSSEPFSGRLSELYNRIVVLLFCYLSSCGSLVMVTRGLFSQKLVFSQGLWGRTGVETFSL